MTRQELKNNIFVTAIALSIATVLSYLFFLATQNTTNVALVYVLTIVLIARYTTGYHPGFIASVISVILVNFGFTYPYWKINFTMSGYPLTFLGMLSVSVITSTATTHLKMQAEMIENQAKQLLEAEKETMRANLLRAISHDLRTPLTGIIGSSTAYLENKPYLSEDERDTLVAHIQEDATWLLHMVENLLSVTRINANNATVTANDEPVEEVVEEAVTRLRKRIPGIALKVQVPDEFYLIPMDATLIEQVIINLVENAALHSGTTAPIELNVFREGDNIRFDIVDYGKGIEKNRLETLFDGTNFYADNTGGDIRKGIGIGLSICKTIITAHKGTIAASNHGHGAKFSFTLPMQKN